MSIYSLLAIPSMLQVLDRKTIQKLGGELNNASASKPSSFAVKLMEKMGWKDGQGLGKNADGIASHVIISKREDNVGLGLGKEGKDSSQKGQLSDHWWHTDFSAQLKAFKGAVKTADSKDKKKDRKKDKKRKLDSLDDDGNDNDSDNGGNENSKSERKGFKEKKEKKAKKDGKAEKKEKRSKRDVERSANELDEDTPLDYQELFKATGGARLGMRARRDQKGKIARTEGAQALVI